MLLLIDAILPLLCASALISPSSAAPSARDVDKQQETPELWTPSDDTDFEAEGLSQVANAALKALQEKLAAGDLSGEGLKGLVHSQGFKSNDLRPELELRRDAGGIRASIAKPESFGLLGSGTPPGIALGAFLAPLSEGTEQRVAFKIVHVEPQDENHFRVEALLQTSARLGKGSTQQNARWSIGFESRDEAGGFQISSIQALSLTEVSFAEVLFQDSSAKAIANAGGSSVVLAKGSEHWHGRIDNLGEANYFGHNGIAVGDVNGDDLDDLYVAQGTGLPNLLFMQQPSGSFVEMGEHSGAAWLDDTKGVLLADYDNDGDRDLIACIGPLIILSTNDGEGIFTPARQLGSESTSSFYSLSAADYDLDGDLDIFAVRYVKTSYGDSVPIPFHDARNGPKNHLMRNDGELGFADVSAEVGLDVNNDRFSLASSWSDYDNDGDPDLYVANDFGRNNLYRNDGGKFVDVAAETGCEDQAAGMGVSWADVDLDGRFDVLVSNMFSSAGRRIAYQSSFKQGEDPAQRHAIQRHALGNSLFSNKADGSFEDVSESAGLRMGRWSWGARFSDFDMDGLPDVVVPNGFLTGDHKDDL